MYLDMRKCLFIIKCTFLGCGNVILIYILEKMYPWQAWRIIKSSVTLNILQMEFLN